MGKTLLFLMVLSVKLTFAQVNDDFTDGDFTVNPIWKGSTYFYIVNAAKQLQAISRASAQTVSLSTSNLLAVNVKWEFDLQLNFDPSATNQAKIYLISDQQDLGAPLNGYFIQIGESGSADSYDLYRQTGTAVVKIIDGPSKTRTNVNQLNASLRITRNELGKWELYTDLTGTKTYTLEGTTTDLTFGNTDWFGVNCTYTATRADGFIFDNFKVEELVPDRTAPSLLSAKVIDEFTVETVFSERLQLAEAINRENYVLTSVGLPNSILATNLPNVYRLVYNSALPTGDYRLTVNNVKDLKGNLIGNNVVEFFYLQPYLLQKGDLLLSEILFNPKSGGVDFVEIYNNTSQILELSELQLANVDVNGNPANIKKVSAVPVYLLPNTYWVLTSSPEIIKQHYQARFAKQFVQMASLPAYNNDKGSVVLLGNRGVLDRFDYSEKMHLALLQNADGVSLERVSFLRGTNEFGNFTSAAASSGFATPTFKNSQQIDPAVAKSRVSLTNKVFSPDHDGFEDQLQISYEFGSNGNLANVNVYTDRGILVRRLERNISVATAGSLIWDGLNDAGQLTKVGIYVIRFDVFRLDGSVESFKKVCVLAAKLN